MLRLACTLLLASRRRHPTGAADGRATRRALRRARRDLRQMARAAARARADRHGRLGAGIDCQRAAMPRASRRSKISCSATGSPSRRPDRQRSTTPIASISTSRPGTASALTATRVEVTTDPLSAVPSALVTARHVADVGDEDRHAREVGEARPGRLQRRLDLAHGDLGLLGGVLALDPALGIERGRARHEHERTAA